VSLPARGVIELAELKGYLNVKRTERDEFLQLLLDGAVAFAGGTYTKRALEPLDDVSVRRRVNGSRFIRLPDARTVTKVELDGNEVTDYELLDSPGSSDTTVTIEVFARARIAIVTGQFGMEVVPADLRVAIMVLAARRYWQREAGQSDSVQSQEYGTATYFKELPAEVRVVLDRYSVPSDWMGLG